MNKIIEDYPDFQVTKKGEIYSSISNKILQPNYKYKKDGFGYVTLRTRVGGKSLDSSRKDIRIDLLVANAYLDNPTKCTVVNHKDGKIRNCHPDNLEWATKMIMLKKNVNDYYIYFNLNNGKFRLYDSRSKTITTVDNLPSEKGAKTFSLTKPYTTTDTEIIRYVEDFDISCDQLLDNDIFSFNYKFAYNHNVAVMNFFNQTSKGKIDHHKEQTETEYKWSKKCRNSAPLYCNKGTYQCYGYDFSFNHGTIMAKSALTIPTRKGKEYFLDCFDKHNLDIGYYRVKITSNHEDIDKVFYFSAEHIYTNIDLQFVIENKKKFKFKIELIIDDEPNAYLYNNDYVESTSSIFNDWYDILVKLRKAFPKNILVKFMCSSLHGQFASANTITKSKEQVKEEGLNICYSDDADYKIVSYENYNFGEKELYELLNNRKPYKHNLRLQSFLMSECRVRMANIVMHDIKNVVRIHTDNVTFKDVDPKFKIEGFKPETKTTGLIKWHNVNKSERL